MISEMLSYPFMRMAFIAVLLLAPALGILGTMVVEKKMAFFSDAIGHSALTGIAIGVLCGMGSSGIAVVIYAAIFAILLNEIRFRGHSSTDTIISVMASASLALGLAILSRGGSFSGYSSLLIGDILSISRDDLLALAVVFVITIAFAFFFFNSVLAVAIHPTLAKVSGIRFRLLEHGFAVLVAIVVALSIRWIGILLINAMLILPAASARSISGNLREYMGLTLAFSIFSSVIGLALSYFLSIASGPAIVIISALIYAVCYVYGRNKQ